eukprot:SAG22_NODE_19584_length_273_cov_1.114943_2_plen_24_part_01
MVSCLFEITTDHWQQTGTKIYMHE